MPNSPVTVQEEGQDVPTGLGTLAEAAAGAPSHLTLGLEGHREGQREKIDLLRWFIRSRDTKP